MTILWVGLAGALGALGRYELSRAIHRRTARADLATMTVNLLGAFAMGLLIGFDHQRQLDPEVLIAMTAGFIGGFTTFSTWMLDVIVLAEDESRDRRLWAMGSLAVTLAGGLGAYVVGLWLATAIA